MSGTDKTIPIDAPPIKLVAARWLILEKVSPSISADLPLRFYSSHSKEDTSKVTSEIAKFVESRGITAPAVIKDVCHVSRVYLTWWPL